MGGVCVCVCGGLCVCGGGFLHNTDDPPPLPPRSPARSHSSAAGLYLYKSLAPPDRKDLSTSLYTQVPFPAAAPLPEPSARARRALVRRSAAARIPGGGRDGGLRVSLEEGTESLDSKELSPWIRRS